MRVKSYKTFDKVEDTFINGHDMVNPGTATYGEDRDGPYCVQLTARCRKCEKCLKLRAQSWAARCRAEISVSRRTWFATLTYRPEARYLAELRARQALGRRGTDFDQLSGNEQFQALHNVMQRDVTLMLKRLRKAGAVFRYLLVLEPHKDGQPHYHLMIHETAEPIRYATLKEQWSLGFSQFKLLETDEPKAAWYAAKYLSKHQASRVRASLKYGQISERNLALTTLVDSVDDTWKADP